MVIQKLTISSKKNLIILKDNIRWDHYSLIHSCTLDVQGIVQCRRVQYARYSYTCILQMQLLLQWKYTSDEAEIYLMKSQLRFEKLCFFQM